jgi:hypothetical protein
MRRRGRRDLGSCPVTLLVYQRGSECRVPFAKLERNASFDPVTVRKGQRRLDGLTGNVISLYVKG